MKLTDILYESAKDIWDSYYEHPFVKGIGNGTLDIEKFRYYMIQDYLYLLDYAKVFALGVVKSKDEDMMRYFAGFVYNVLNGEMKIHKSYMERLGITKEEVENSKQALDNISYTNYMLWIGSNEGVLELLTAILSCAWSYQKIGEHLALNKESCEHEFYGEWVRGYSSKEYADGNIELFDMINNLSENITENQIENLKSIFVNCSKYEYMFWDMAYEMKV